MEQTPNEKEVAVEFPYSRLYTDGSIDRFDGDPTVPPSPDSEDGVRSKDIVISPESGLSARIFLPRISDPTRKLPLLVYYHGGAFCVETPFSPIFSPYVASLAREANVVALSVNYRRAPEDHLPAAYDDAWAAIRWAAAHYGGNGPEEWINEHADLERVFVGGDSAGGTLSHSVVLRAGVDGLGLSGSRIAGLVLFHPYFNGDERNKLLEYIFPTHSGPRDPLVNPFHDPNLGKVGCDGVMVFVAEKDFLKERGWAYYEALKKSGWSGVADIFETEGEDHDFHLFKPQSEKAHAQMKRAVSFLNRAWSRGGNSCCRVIFVSCRGIYLTSNYQTQTRHVYYSCHDL
ncbi:Alpha/beta hydrolase fold [Trema orientale]|uniref:Alpha/beta hydrolase fold n=1 Tax=Trema orientale TaxID=63057 RepID=A0A2P5FZA4_TREOI|nr:Alpha/beta hydrolase fold [Trema orientale]